MLDVDGGDDVDPRCEDLLDVLISLLVADPGHVGVRQLVDERHLGPPREDTVEVHLLHELPAVLDLQAGDDLEAPDRLLGELAAVGLDEADDDVLSLGAAVVRLAEHRERLAAPRGGAQEDTEVPAPRRGRCGDRRCRRCDRVRHQPQ